MKYLVTSALPYANAPLHLGHVLEIVQTDIWTRHINLTEDEAYYFCASDTHGTPVMLKAKELDIKPEELISQIYENHLNTFKKFNINLTNFHTTHSPENEQLTAEIFNKSISDGYIKKKLISQLFDETEGIFLSDRFIKGTCPVCKKPDQYGDACEECGSTYDALDILQPISVLSNSTPIVKESEHYFFELSKLENYLESHIENINKQKPIKSKLSEWFNDGLKDWDVSRDAPYFGFKVPGETDKYIYVWMDAPVGYLASMKNWFETKGENFLEIANHKDTKLVHFIGKDIVYFHLLFWPAMLKVANFNNLEEVFVHGFLTIEGKKMSKSKGNFILADKALEHADADFYRYYLASKLNTDISDIDFSVEDFIQKVNSDLIGKYINIGSRTQNFIYKLSEGELQPNANVLSSGFVDTFQQIVKDTHNKEYSKALRAVMSIADKTNAYISEKEPWTKAKNGNDEECIAICSEALNVFKNLTIVLNPYIPEITKNIFDLLNLEHQTYKDLGKPLEGTINQFKPFISRLEKSELDGILE